MSELLESINSLKDFKGLKVSQLPALCGEIREYLLETVQETGGHLASNLGVVELTVALHWVFDCPEDKIVFDVGHQSYVHKILTGRREELKTIRETGGISGFPSIFESEFDAFGTGHSSTAISAGLGLARARDLGGKKFNVVSVVGDGALSGGMCFEALNDAGASDTPFLIILNDNSMSISGNVGAMAGHLARLRIRPKYTRTKRRLERVLAAVPLFGKELQYGLKKVKNALRSVFLPNKIFDQMGVKYVGRVDGHDLFKLIDCLQDCRDYKHPLILHVITKKGRGFPAAEQDPTRFHGIEGSRAGEPCNSFSLSAGQELVSLAAGRGNVTAITAGMEDGTGLAAFHKAHPDRFFDVGIAEQHAVTMAAGMAAGGLKPYVAVYSTFLQRAFDQILHDVCLQKLPVTFLIDRAGINGPDGCTHQGIYDLTYLGSMPGAVIFTPSDTAELRAAIEWSYYQSGPVFLRYPRDSHSRYTTASRDELLDKFNSFSWDYVGSGALSGGERGIYILAAGGRMLELGSAAIELLPGGISDSVRLVNARFISPLDVKFLDEINKKGNLIITLEDNITAGGFGSRILEYFNAKERLARVEVLGIPEKTLPHGRPADIMARCGLTPERVSEVCREFYLQTADGFPHSADAIGLAGGKKQADKRKTV